MIHIQHGEAARLDMARFNDAFMMHTSTSPQYGIIASCDVAAAMMEPPAGRALVQEMIEEALGFRRAMAAVKKQLNGSWWFDVWQPDEIAEHPVETTAAWVLKPGDPWHGFKDLAENHVLVDPVKVTILTPGLTADGSMQDPGIPAAVVTKFLSARRIEIEKTGLYSFLVLFSMGITRGKWSTLVTELMNFKDLHDSNTSLARVLPQLVEAHPETYAKMGLKELCERMHRTYREDDLTRAQSVMYTVARDDDASGRCLRAPSARRSGKRRNRRSNRSDFGRDGGSLSARDTVDHAGGAAYVGDQIDTRLSAVRA
jgi:arginine decarboxylase